MADECIVRLTWDEACLVRGVLAREAYGSERTCNVLRVKMVAHILAKIDEARAETTKSRRAMRGRERPREDDLPYDGKEW